MDYYDIPALSASAINNFIGDRGSPAHFWRSTPLNPNREKVEDTPALVIGKAAHCLLLEGEEVFNSQFAIAPDAKRTTKAVKAEYADFINENDGKSILTNDMVKNVYSMVNAVKSNEVANKLLRNGEAEGDVFFEMYGMPCKSKIDYRREGLLIDYKTTLASSIEAFKRSSVKYGYHRQVAFYMDAYKAKYGEYPKGFVFLLQNKEIHNGVGFCSLDEEAVDTGRYENEIAANAIKRRLDENDWDMFEQKIVSFGLTDWYKTITKDEVK